MSIRVMKGVGAVLLLAAAAARADDAALPSLDYTYAGSFGGLSIGDVNVSLKPEGEAGCYKYTTISKPAGFVRALYGSPNQFSSFCVKDGHIVSKRFEARLEGDDKQSYTLDFAADGTSVTDENGVKRDVPAGTVDNFSLQQAVRLWVIAHAKDSNPPIAEFDTVDRKNITHYKFQLSGHEQVQTPAGSFDTIKMERIDNPKKVGLFWIAPGKDMMPVKITTQSGNAPAVELILRK
jgi:hypothetical protein